MLTRCGVVRPSLTRQLVSGKGGVGGSAPDSLKYILILECGEGVFGSSLDRCLDWLRLKRRKREGEVLGGCAGLRQVHSASAGPCEASRSVRGAAKFVGCSWALRRSSQINTDIKIK